MTITETDKKQIIKVVATPFQKRKELPLDLAIKLNAKAKQLEQMGPSKRHLYRLFLNLFYTNDKAVFVEALKELVQKLEAGDDGLRIKGKESRALTASCSKLLTSSLGNSWGGCYQLSYVSIDYRKVDKNKLEKISGKYKNLS